MNTQVEKINFSGDLIEAIEQDGKIFIVLKRICENLSIDWEPQRKRIERDFTLNRATSIMEVPSNSGIQKTICLPLNYLNGFLFGMDDSRIKDPLVQSNIRAYKEKCYDVLFNHFYNKPIQQQNNYEQQITDLYKQLISNLQAQIDTQKQQIDNLRQDYKDSYDKLFENCNKAFQVVGNRILSIESNTKTIALQTAAQANKAANNLGNNVQFITLSEAKKDPKFQNNIKKYSERKGYMALSHALKLFAHERASQIKKDGQLNKYPYQIITDFFDPNFNPDIAKIIPILVK